MPSVVYPGAELLGFSLVFAETPSWLPDDGKMILENLLSSKTVRRKWEFPSPLKYFNY
jgi:hypothetical protein